MSKTIREITNETQFTQAQRGWHDRACEELELINFSEREVVTTSVGIWQGLAFYNQNNERVDPTNIALRLGVDMDFNSDSRMISNEEYSRLKAKLEKAEAAFERIECRCHHFIDESKYVCRRCEALEEIRK